MKQKRLDIQVRSIWEGKIEVIINTLDSSLLWEKWKIMFTECFSPNLPGTFSQEQCIIEEKFEYKTTNKFVFFVWDRFSYKWKLFRFIYNITAIVHFKNKNFSTVLKKIEVNKDFIKEYYAPKIKKDNSFSETLLSNLSSPYSAAFLITASLLFFLLFVFVILLWSAFILRTWNVELIIILIFLLLIGLIWVFHKVLNIRFTWFSRYIKADLKRNNIWLYFNRDYNLEDIFTWTSTIDLHEVNFLLVAYFREEYKKRPRRQTKKWNLMTRNTFENIIYSEIIDFIPKKTNLFEYSRKKLFFDKDSLFLIPLNYKFWNTILKTHLFRKLELRIKVKWIAKYTIQIPLDMFIDSDIEIIKN